MKYSRVREILLLDVKNAVFLQHDEFPTVS